MIKLNAAQLRNTEPEKKDLKSIKKNPIYILLDNVLDTYNVGSVFRLADAVAAKKLFLCGETETPPNPRIKKASVSTWKWVEWEYARTVVSALEKIKSEEGKLKIIVVEQNKKSISLDKLKADYPLAVVAGNETFGVSKEVLKKADAIVELPMYGVNKSLNVMVSCGIVLYKIIELISKEEKKNIQK